MLVVGWRCPFKVRETESSCWPLWPRKLFQNEYLIKILPLERILVFICAGYSLCRILWHFSTTKSKILLLVLTEISKNVTYSVTISDRHCILVYFCTVSWGNPFRSRKWVVGWGEGLVWGTRHHLNVNAKNSITFFLITGTSEHWLLWSPLLLLL